MRFTVFYQEFAHKKKLWHMDFEKFDTTCDHLMIVRKKSNKCIGTYRLLSSHFSNNFYSHNEYDIKNIIKLPDPKLEIGRACVDREERKGIVLTLLWEGICRYITMTQSRYVFGCSSIKPTDVRTIAIVFKYLRDLYYSPEDLRVYPRKDTQVTGLENALKNHNPSVDKELEKDAQSHIPPLLRSYFKIGTMICGEPVRDNYFKCVDFLTLLDIENCLPAFKRKFLQ